MQLSEMDWSLRVNICVMKNSFIWITIIMEKITLRYWEFVNKTRSLFNVRSKLENYLMFVNSKQYFNKKNF